MRIRNMKIYTLFLPIRIPFSVLLLFLIILVCARSTPVCAEEETMIRVTVPRVEEEGFDGQQIAQAVDDYVSAKSGFHVDLNFVVMDRYEREIAHESLLNTLPDVFFIWDRAMASGLIQKKQLAPLEDLLHEHAADLVASFGEELSLANAGFDGIYVLPNQLDRENSSCFEYRASIADKYHLEMENVHSLQDLSAVFEKLHAEDPGIVCSDSLSLGTYDALGDSLGVLMDCGRSDQVVNLYETEEYRQFVLLIAKWREKGYLLDNNLGYDSINRFVASPEIFGKCTNYHPALVNVDSADAGEEIRTVMLNDSFVTTDDYQTFQYGISAGSQHQEYAMQFLKLLFTDEILVNLLTYGIEGVHYQVIDEALQTISFPEEMQDGGNNYHQFRGYYYGNEYLCRLWEGYPLDLWEQEKAFNHSIRRSYACGFVFDPTFASSANEACIQVVNAYLPLLEEGIGNTKTLLSTMNAALHEAGIDLVIAEKQRQLDLWKEKNR